MPENGAAPVAVPLGRIVRVEAWALRAPIVTPVVTSFGTMRDRPAVFVRLTDADGCHGWGEAWCNFPGVGAEHRARLLIDTVAPLAIGGGAWTDVGALWRALDSRLHVLALQTGEPGPLAQCAASIDMAASDLAARRAGQPLWRMLGGHAGSARVYASGIHPDGALSLAQRMADRGHRAFKLKVGFEPRSDGQCLAALRRELGDDATLMVDANQAWTPSIARERIARLAASRPAWVEEPIAADQRLQSWVSLAAASAVPLAAGENLRGEHEFERLMTRGALGIVQPDAGKWGGLTGCRAVARRALELGVSFCPHWLGGPVGLLASMHLRASLGQGGWVEWDANPNPMHEPLATSLPAVVDGRIELGHGAGLGFEVDMSAYARFVTWQGAS